MLNDLLLLSGNDIPLPEARLIIHQPTVKEIGFIGEDNFYLGCEFLTFSKNRLSAEDKERAKDQDDFLLFMGLIKENNPALKQSIRAAFMVLTLIFPKYSLSLDADKIILTSEEMNADFYLDSKSFSSFKQILSEMFCLSQSGLQETYNPEGSMAQKIAEKLQKRKAVIAKQKSGNSANSKVAILSRYVSILTTGTQRDMNSYLNYTVYQLFDEFQRFELKMHYDINFKARLAGAKDLPEVEDWMKDIHS